MTTPYEMKISLNVLKHLGMNLYTNVPAVLSEVVANAWDADATKVCITLSKDEIIIQDDGHGMTQSNINERFLRVGYDRRKKLGGTSEKLNRPVMGRKGIGKLSLFSIADEIEVSSTRSGKSNAFKMIRSDIETMLNRDKNATYFPASTTPTKVTPHGTYIRLTGLRKNITESSNAFLKRRLARRFSVLGPKHSFEVSLNDQVILVEDRDYFSKLQFVWWLGKDKDLKSKCHNVDDDNHMYLTQQVGHRQDDWKVSGWLGTAKVPKDLKDDGDSLNKITLVVRGKLAQEDILASIAPAGIFTKYLFGEVHADFLDLDDMADIATSSRQGINEDDPRYVALKTLLKKHLSEIEKGWSDKRGKKGVEEAKQNVIIRDWFDRLRPDAKKQAEELFGRISRIATDSLHRNMLFKHAILAFETLRQQDKLAELAELEDSDIAGFMAVFKSLDEIEAVFYHQIVKERLKVIETLQRRVDENALEKVLQELLFDNLWLLDPSWERAADSEFTEKTVKKALNSRGTTLSPDEAKGRIDIGYKKASGQHVIVELKRADRPVTSVEIIGQCSKYLRAVDKVLIEGGERNPVIKIVVVLGSLPSDYQDNSKYREQGEKSLAAFNTTVTTYHELLKSAHSAYSEMFEKKKRAGSILELVGKIDIQG